MTQPRCLGHLLGSRRPPVNVVAGLQSDLTNEFALCPAIAFPKRMSRENRPRDRQTSRHPGERGSSPSRVSPGSVAAPVRGTQRFRRDGRPWIYSPSETVPPIRTHPGRFTDESPEGARCRISRASGYDQLRNALVRAACFEACQLFWVSEAAQVLEDVCAGIEIRVRTLGHRAHRSRSLLQLASTLH
jgi:hypothetical protein